MSSISISLWLNWLLGFRWMCQWFWVGWLVWTWPRYDDAFDIHISSAIGFLASGGWADGCGLVDCMAWTWPRYNPTFDINISSAPIRFLASNGWAVGCGLVGWHGLTVGWLWLKELPTFQFHLGAIKLWLKTNRWCKSMWNVKQRALAEDKLFYLVVILNGSNIVFPPCHQKPVTSHGYFIINPLLIHHWPIIDFIHP